MLAPPGQTLQASSARTCACVCASKKIPSQKKKKTPSYKQSAAQSDGGVDRESDTVVDEEEMSDSDCAQCFFGGDLASRLLRLQSG